MSESQYFIMTNGKVLTLSEALEDADLTDIRLVLEDGTQLTFWKTDHHGMQKYMHYGVRSHKKRYITEEYEIAEVPPNFYEKTEVEQEKQKIAIKRILSGRWGYDIGGRIIFEMPDGTYKYIYSGTPSRQLKESDLKSLSNACVTAYRNKNTLTGTAAAIICKTYGLKFYGEEE